MSRINVEIKIIYKYIYKTNIPPNRSTTTENTFSAAVFGAILPNPTVVKLVSMKYNELIYASPFDGPVSKLLFVYGLPI